MKIQLANHQWTSRVPVSLAYWLAAALLGFAANLMLHQSGYSLFIPPQLLALLLKVYHTAGTVLIGLTPMIIWLTRNMVRHLRGVRQGATSDLDLGYIQRNAMLVGLAGTVCALIGSTATLAKEVTNGSAVAVLKLIPVVGEALVSTLLGLMVAMWADLMLHLRERQQLKQSQNHEPGQSAQG